MPATSGRRRSSARPCPRDPPRRRGRRGGPQPNVAARQAPTDRRPGDACVTGRDRLPEAGPRPRRSTTGRSPPRRRSRSKGPDRRSCHRRWCAAGGCRSVVARQTKASAQRIDVSVAGVSLRRSTQVMPPSSVRSTVPPSPAANPISESTNSMLRRPCAALCARSQDVPASVVRYRRPEAVASTPRSSDVNATAVGGAVGSPADGGSVTRVHVRPPSTVWWTVPFWSAR